MPNYMYKCISCGQVINIFHSFAEKATDCELCGAENSLQRDFSAPFTFTGKSIEKKSQPGQVVNEFIEQAKEQIKKDKLNRDFLDD